MGGMIFYGIFRLLHWLYGWGEITENTREMMTALSGFEMMIFSMVLIVFCSIYIYNIIENRWNRK
jgi:uncharacterized membrane protein